ASTVPRIRASASSSPPASAAVLICRDIAPSAVRQASPRQHRRGDRGDVDGERPADQAEDAGPHPSRAECGELGEGGPGSVRNRGGAAPIASIHALASSMWPAMVGCTPSAAHASGAARSWALSTTLWNATNTAPNSPARRLTILRRTV